MTGNCILIRKSRFISCRLGRSSKLKTDSFNKTNLNFAPKKNFIFNLSRPLWKEVLLFFFKFSRGKSPILLRNGLYRLCNLPQIFQSQTGLRHNFVWPSIWPELHKSLVGEESGLSYLPQPVDNWGIEEGILFPCPCNNPGTTGQAGCGGVEEEGGKYHSEDRRIAKGL